MTATESMIADLQHGPHGQTERRIIGELLHEVVQSATYSHESPEVACVGALYQLIEEAQSVLRTLSHALPPRQAFASAAAPPSEVRCLTELSPRPQ